jgi:hypothetical protein
MPGYLILYRRHSGERQVIEFGGPGGHREAVNMRLRLEAEKRFAGENIEIAAISSDSIETVRSTHSRYFEGDEVDLLGELKV